MLRCGNPVGKLETMGELTGLDRDLVKYLSIAGFVDGRTLDASFENEDDAIEFLTALSEPGQVDPWTIAEWGEELMDWKKRCSHQLRSALKRVVAGTDEGIISVKAKLHAAASLIAAAPLVHLIEADVKVLHWRTRLAQKLRTVEDPGQRHALEESDRLRWVMALGEIFERAGLPTALLAAKSLHPRRALQGAAGTLRAKTLRSRVRTWWKIRD